MMRTSKKAAAQRITTLAHDVRAAAFEHDVRIVALEHDVKVLAWLHAGLVYELQTVLTQLVNHQLNTAAAQQADPTIVARARRIAALRTAAQGTPT